MSAPAPTRPVAPSAEDPLARAASEALGGPWGRHAGGGPRWLTAAVVCLPVAMVSLALGVLQKQHCRAEGWRTPDQFFHACYSDVPVVFSSSGLVGAQSPYAEGVALLQPSLTAGLAWLLTRFAPPDVTPEAQRAYFDAATVVIALLLLVTVAAVLAMAGRRRWDTLLLAASPLVVLAGLVSLDLLGVALATAGLAAWARRRPVAAGVLLGLAVCARTYPVVIVVALALLAVRTGRYAAFSRTAVAAALTWLAVNVPLAVTWGSAWSDHLTQWWPRQAGYGSPWLLPQLLEQALHDRAATGLPGEVVTVLTLTTGALGVLAVATVVLWAPRRPRVPQVALLLVAVVVLTGKALPVQVSLWLLPLAVLAVPRWRDHAVWLGTEALYFVGVWLFIAGQSTPDRGLPSEVYLLLLLLRLGGIGWLVAAVLRDLGRPAGDPVRAAAAPGGGQADDPAGGDFDGAPDALVIRVA
ncbi:putative membrane protein [Kineococcus xinjiangensis]|uniref:Putative membrane protein n=1 Tax=Kineococcus xinjiangensis TaxID=512762 RepID=A0A2S6IVA7_9ACTN|nr:glycosyltransferase 87 family protein [Kineococcus xinjiangensis]PPK98212.1 putative membrane protein [Kineococcus xinjiangensis]